MKILSSRVTDTGPVLLSSCVDDPTGGVRIGGGPHRVRFVHPVLPALPVVAERRVGFGRATTSPMVGRR